MGEAVTPYIGSIFTNIWNSPPPIHYLLISISMTLATIAIWMLHRRRTVDALVIAEKTAGVALTNINILRSKVADRYQRWEEISEIRFSYVDFFPTAYTKLDNQSTVLGKPSEKLYCGVGFKKLLDAFSNDQGQDNRKEFEKLTFVRQNGVAFNEINDLFVSNKIDLIVTPLYQFRERIAEFQFCNTIYWANIGCYVSLADQFFKDRCLDFPLNWDESIATLREYIQLNRGQKHFRYLPDDLHQRTCEKYLSLTKEEMIEIGNWNMRGLIDTFAEGGTPFLFAETIAVEHYLEELGKDKGFIENILKDNAYLLPAAYIVRANDDTLMRLINYKLDRASADGFRLPSEQDYQERLKETLKA
ncbi:MAG: hypothetical protein ACFHX7_22035 [Pseudomonadota bacterium]